MYAVMQYRLRHVYVRTPGNDEPTAAQKRHLWPTYTKSDRVSSPRSFQQNRQCFFTFNFMIKLPKFNFCYKCSITAESRRVIFGNRCVSTLHYTVELQQKHQCPSPSIIWSNFRNITVFALALYWLRLESSLLDVLAC